MNTSEIQWPWGEKGNARWVFLLVGFAWLSVGALDWGLRFTRYKWHESLIVRPAKAPEAGSGMQIALGPYRPFSTQEVGTVTGGDLSRMLEFPWLRKAYEQPREGWTLVTDESGYRNSWRRGEDLAKIVVVGDSYMIEGGGRENALSGKLETLSGEPVYELAFAGRGPQVPVRRYMSDPRFRNRPPEVLVWGLIERDFGGAAFTGLVYHFHHPEVSTGTAMARLQASGSTKIFWSWLTPEALGQALPNTSIVSQLSRKIWRYTRYIVFRQITPDVVVSTGEVEGKKLLFYAGSIEAMKWTREQRDIEKVTWAIDHLRQFCADEGTRLVVLLIPDKAQVFRDLIPAAAIGEGTTIPASCLWELEASLEDKGITTVNLLPVYRDRVERGQLMYWPDDTHWNQLGIDVAVQEVWKRVEPLLAGEPEDDPTK